MQAVVNSVLQVSSVIEEISQASHEQTDGIEQINQAVAIDGSGTQQNAALVEEAAAAAAAARARTDAGGDFPPGRSHQAPAPLDWHGTAATDLSAFRTRQPSK